MTSTPAIFAAALARVIEPIRTRLPRGAVGDLQLQVLSEHGNGHAYVSVRPGGVTPHSGLAVGARGWIVAKEADIKSWLETGKLAESTLEILGDRSFVLGLFDALANAPPSGSPLQLRLQR
jgi:hypothetical protein